MLNTNEVDLPPIVSEKCLCKFRPGDLNHTPNKVEFSSSIYFGRL